MWKILYRDSLVDEEELAAIKKYFPDSVDNMALVQKGDWIIPRYSVLPFANDFYTGLDILKAVRISDFNTHQILADITRYYPIISEFTPQYWDLDQDLWKLPEDKSFVLKGQTNSRKDKWSTHMFAKDKKEAIQVFCRLTDDGLINTQKILAREYVQLETFIEGLNGLPITNEWRFFCHESHIISWDFYWQNYLDDLPDKILDRLERQKGHMPWSFIAKAMSKLQHLPFYVMDIGKKSNGEWIIIELNDACMSGLSCINPLQFYRTLKEMADKCIL